MSFSPPTLFFSLFNFLVTSNFHLSSGELCTSVAGTRKECDCKEETPYIYDCRNQTITCNQGVPCMVTCNNPGICSGLQVYSNGASAFIMQCNDCNGAVVYCQEGTSDCNFYCGQNNTCALTVYESSGSYAHCNDAGDVGNCNDVINKVQLTTKTPTTATLNPTIYPSKDPTLSPTANPTLIPTFLPSKYPTTSPTTIPTLVPTLLPSLSPTTSQQTRSPVIGLVAGPTTSTTIAKSGDVDEIQQRTTSISEEDGNGIKIHNDSHNDLSIIIAIVVTVSICCVLLLIMLIKKRKDKMKIVENKIGIQEHEAQIQSVQSVSIAASIDPSNDIGGSDMIMQAVEYIDDEVITPSMITPMIPQDMENNIYKADEGVISYNDNDEDVDGDVLTGVNTLNGDNLLHGSNKTGPNIETVENDEFVVESDDDKPTSNGQVAQNLADDEFIIQEDKQTSNGNDRNDLEHDEFLVHGNDDSTIQ